jgi:multidrug efflux system membrane fusion protein
MNEPQPSGTRATGRRAIALLAPILVAVVLFAVLWAGRPRPAERPVADRGRPVRVIAIQERSVVPKAVGYGVVQAAYEWELVAEVSGRVVEMNPDLRVGATIPQGTKLLKIDAQNYELTEQQKRASLQNINAQLAQLNAQKESAKANLQIERQSLALAERDLKRNRSLFSTGGATQADVDNAQRNVLAQRSLVQQLENQLRELPANIAALRAQQRESQARLQGASLDVDRTEIVAPFDIRIRELSIQPSELVTAGQTLAVADGVEAAEVPAQLTFGALQSLLDGASSVGSLLPGVQSPAAVGRQLRNLGLEALVTIESGGMVAQWSGEVTRIATVDATTRTVGVVVSIGDPVGSPSSPPLLLSGMYARVELTGAEQTGCLAVPRSAVRAGDQLHLVDGSSRLTRRRVSVGIRQPTFVCVTEGVEAEELVVLTDLEPAVEGMLLEPSVDEVADAQLVRDLAGGGTVE